MNPASRAVDAFWRAAAFPFREVRSDDELHYRRSRWFLRGFYGFVLLFMVSYGLPKTKFHLVPHDDPLWPVVWMSWLPWELGVYAVTGACLAGAILAALQPHWRWTRIWAFLGLFQFLALWYTYTGVQHRTYTMLSLAFFFALLPRVRAAGAGRDESLGRYLTVVWGGMAFVLMTYSMAGLLKIEGIVEALARGDELVLDFGEVPIHLLKRAFKFENPPILSEFVLNHPGLASLGLFTVVYLEFCSLSVAYRPHLQRYWFAIMAWFHFSTEWTMRVFFVPATAVLVLYVIFSPFSRPWRTWRAALRELPLFGPLLATLLFRILPVRDTETIVYGDPASALSAATTTAENA